MSYQNNLVATNKYNSDHGLLWKWLVNPSSPKGGGCTNPPPNGYRPGAQNRTAKG